MAPERKDKMDNLGISLLNKLFLVKHVVTPNYQIYLAIRWSYPPLE